MKKYGVLHLSNNTQRLVCRDISAFAVFSCS